jgi:hypothetical protein
VLQHDCYLAIAGMLNDDIQASGNALSVTTDHCTQAGRSLICVTVHFVLEWQLQSVLVGLVPTEDLSLTADNLGKIVLASIDMNLGSDVAVFCTTTDNASTMVKASDTLSGGKGKGMRFVVSMCVRARYLTREPQRQSQRSRGHRHGEAALSRRQ